MAVVTNPAKVDNTMLTQIELLRRTDPKGNVADIAEVLNETNEIIQDVSFKEGNLLQGDEQVIRNGLPDVYWKQKGRGVPASTSQTATVTETCATMAAMSKIPVDILALNGNDAAYRKTEEAPFIESMGQKFASTLFYGDGTKVAEGFTGLATRYSTLDTSKAENAKNVIDCGGTGNKLTSIYIVGWGDSIYCPYPKGSKVGLQSTDKGAIILPDDLGNLTEYYVSMYEWNVGLMVKDWRCVVRLANINPDELFSGKGMGNGDLKTANSTNILLKLDEGISKLRKTGSQRYAIYMNNDVHEGIAVVAARTNMQVIKYSEASTEYGNHSVWSSYRGYPMRQCDQIVNTETLVK